MTDLKRKLQRALGKIIHEDRHFQFTETLIDILCQQRAALEKLTHHNECEDCFYSCPKAKNYCGQESDEADCDCSGEWAIEALAATDEALKRMGCE